MIPSDTRKPKVNRSNRTASDAGILSLIDLNEPPFTGNKLAFFDDATLDSARQMVKAGLAQVVTVNLQGSFAGIFGQFRAREEDPAEEVSLLVQKTIDDEWLLDGKSGPARSNVHSSTAR